MSIGIAIGIVFFSVMCMAYSVRIELEDDRLRRDMNRMKAALELIEHLCEMAGPRGSIDPSTLYEDVRRGLGKQNRELE